MKQQTNTSIEKNESHKTERRQYRENFVASLQHDLSAIPLDSQLKEVICLFFKEKLFFKGNQSQRKQN